jgi:predicted S18 family serine protease
MNLYQKLFTVVIGFSLLTACASTNPPNQQLTETQMVIQQAEQLGAEDYAPLEIRDANIKLGLAREAVEDGNYEKAIKLAEHARVDAELAQIKAQSGKAKKEVAELRESIRVLKAEIERNQKTE